VLRRAVVPKNGGRGGHGHGAIAGIVRGAGGGAAVEKRGGLGLGRISRASVCASSGLAVVVLVDMVTCCIALL